MTEFVRKVVYATVKGGMLKIHFPEVKAGQALISGIAIASTDQELKPTVFPASGWSWEKADKEVMEKTRKSYFRKTKMLVSVYHTKQKRLY